MHEMKNLIRGLFKDLPDQVRNIVDLKILRCLVFLVCFLPAGDGNKGEEKGGGWLRVGN